MWSANTHFHTQPLLRDLCFSRPTPHHRPPTQLAHTMRTSSYTHSTAPPYAQNTQATSQQNQLSRIALTQLPQTANWCLATRHTHAMHAFVSYLGATIAVSLTKLATRQPAAHWATVLGYFYESPQIYSHDFASHAPPPARATCHRLTIAHQLAKAARRGQNGMRKPTSNAVKKRMLAPAEWR